MADFRAIGGVSATLRALLADRMEMPDGVTTVPVTVGPPAFSAKDVDPHPESPRVALFLYRVTENGYLQNQEIPGRGMANGYGHPPLSLNLHYLLTAYGNAEIPGGGAVPLFDDTTAHFLLGSAMRALHDLPVVTGTVTTTRPPSGALVLHESLRDEFEQVKVCLEPLTLEDITKVWTALALRYRLSAAYVVNVVQIESRRPRQFPRRVGQPASPVTPPLPDAPTTSGPMVYVFPIQTPTITDLKVRRTPDPAEQPFPYARILDTLVLRGTSLGAAVVTVAFGELTIPADFAGHDRVEVKIPDATITGVGPIPPERQLQPGVHSVKLVMSDPLAPHSTFASNEAAFMLVPAVNPAVAYAAGPPRSITVNGSRLITPAPGGETVIGRSSVDRASYLSASPTTLVVPIPDTLPAAGVHTLVSGPLPPTVALGAGPRTLIVTIGATAKTATATLPASVAREALAPILGSLIHDALPSDHRFTGARVDLHVDRLVVVPGGLTDPITITSPPGVTFASDLKLTALQPAGAVSALLSGALASPPVLSAPNPRVVLAVGAKSLPVAVPKTTSLASLAASLQATINAGPAPEFAAALVATSGAQLLFIPGTLAAVSFSAAPGDDTTVVELQLHAHFAVRVRANGAESIDPAAVELPQ